MDLSGRRESSHVEDRRGLSTGGKVGIGAILMAAAMAYFTGGDVLQAVIQTATQAQVTQQTDHEFTQEEEEYATFSKQILASTEDVWTEVFKEQGATYEYPKMVLFTSSVSTGCGSASSNVGPFYCSADQSLYIDLSFFNVMDQQLGAKGELSRAYVIAHEVGHHVEYLTGRLTKTHQQMQGLSSAKANQLSVRLELLADYYAGVWARHEGDKFSSFTDTELEQAIQCAQVIGDDYLQKRAGQGVNEESFTHGSSAQRMKWFKKGYNRGDMSGGNTFELDYDDL